VGEACSCALWVGHQTPFAADMMDARHRLRYRCGMNSEPPTLLIPEEELHCAEARLAAFDRDGLGHTLDSLRQWASARAKDPAAPCPTPIRLP